MMHRQVETSGPCALLCTRSADEILSSSISSNNASSRSRSRSTISRSAATRRQTTRTRGGGGGGAAATTTLLSVLACSLTILLMSSCIGSAEAGTLMGHPFSKRSFMDIQCKGVYDKSLFARLDRICEDCYNLFREPQLHTLCRKNCFTSDYFKGCLDVLLLQDEMEWIQTSIKQLHGADPGV